jgi:hypothetical protein
MVPHAGWLFKARVGGTFTHQQEEGPPFSHPARLAIERLGLI